MKKVFILIMSVFCLFSTVLADEPDTKYTEVAYEVEQAYEWTVPSTTEFSLQTLSKELNGEVTVTKCLIADEKKLQISLDDEETANDMLLKYSDDKVAYEISLKEAAADWKALIRGDLVLEVVSGELDPDTGTKAQHLYGKIVGSPKKAGKYASELTFVAEVTDGKTEITDLTGYTWSLKETLSDQQVHDILYAYIQKHPENVGDLVGKVDLYISEQGPNPSWTLGLWLSYENNKFNLWPAASSSIFCEYEDSPTLRGLEWIKFVDGTLLTDADFIKLMQDLGELTLPTE